MVKTRLLWNAVSTIHWQCKCIWRLVDFDILIWLSICLATWTGSTQTYYITGETSYVHHSIQLIINDTIESIQNEPMSIQDIITGKKTMQMKMIKMRPMWKQWMHLTTMGINLMKQRMNLIMAKESYLYLWLWPIVNMLFTMLWPTHRHDWSHFWDCPWNCLRRRLCQARTIPNSITRKIYWHWVVLLRFGGWRSAQKTEISNVKFVEKVMPQKSIFKGHINADHQEVAEIFSCNVCKKTYLQIKSRLHWFYDPCQSSWFVIILLSIFGTLEWW